MYRRFSSRASLVIAPNRHSPSKMGVTHARVRDSFFTQPHDPYHMTVMDCHSLNPFSVISSLAFTSTCLRKAWKAIRRELVTSTSGIKINGFRLSIVGGKCNVFHVGFFIRVISIIYQNCLRSCKVVSINQEMCIV